MKLFLLFSLICACSFALNACNAFVQGIALPGGNLLPDESLNTEQSVEGLIRGVQNACGLSFTRVSLESAALSDECSSVRLSVSISSQLIWLPASDAGAPNNSDPLNTFVFTVQSRFLADNLAERVRQKIPFGSGARSQEWKRQGLYTGYFYGAAARFMFATYFGIERTSGGGVVEEYGRFTPSAELYRQALNLIDSALTLAATPAERQRCNTLGARIALFVGDYQQTERFAQNGLSLGSQPLQFLYLDTDVNLNNIWWLPSTHPSILWVAERFAAYVAQDSAERARIPLARVRFQNRDVLQQQKYLTRSSPMNFLTWQENELMLAECKIRRGANAEALSHINRARASHNLRPLAEATLETIYTERDKELFCTGMRLPDQRRFNRWHLGAGTWQYLPIPQTEFERNPNLRP